MKYIKILFAGLMVITLFGCVHSIVISPKTEKIERELGSLPKIKANVGFFISADSSKKEVSTPGGGGENVRYFPYKDLETAYQLMLLNVFDKVIKLKSVGEQNELSKEGIKFVLEPVLVTTSRSTEIFTWAPTNFTVDLTSNIRDASGKIIGNPRVVGNGHVDFNLEMGGDYGLAGRLAMEDALLKMQRALLEIKYEDIPARIVIPNIGPASNPLLQPKDKASSRLETLKDLFDRGLVTREEYENKRKEILDSL
jgi:hypothetical protein